jgi:hypothetical protein
MPETFIHSNKFSDVELRTLNDDASVGDLAASVEPGAELWLEGAEQALDPGLRLDVAGIGDRANVYVGICKRVTTTVHYNNQTRVIDTPPAATLQSIYDRVTSDAPQGFGLDDLARAEHTLQIKGTTTQPDLSRHVGAFAGDDCTVAFDLVLQQRFQGSR